MKYKIKKPKVPNYGKPPRPTDNCFIDYGFVEQILVAYKIGKITLLEAKIALKSIIN